MDPRRVGDLLDKVRERIGEDEYKRLITELGPDDEMKSAVDFFHLAFCTEQHGSDGCPYYSEDELSTPWSREAHKKWVDKAERLLKGYGLTTDEFSSVLGRVSNTVSALMLCSEPQRLLFLDLLGHEAVQKAVRKEARSLKHLSE